MTDSRAQLQLAAPAKINLGLEVLRRRADGFHDINTLFAAIDLSDCVKLHSRNDGRIICRVTGNERLESEGTNLCSRAAYVLRGYAGREDLGLEIDLAKRIPIGAGLGGGSSDAAAAMLGALRLWGLSVPPATLGRMALDLGSDVPFFLHGGVAAATSRGETLTPIDIRLPYTVLLVNPGIHVSTPWAYRALGRTAERPATDLVAALRRGLEDPLAMREGLHNDFEGVVFAEHPLLPTLKEKLYAAGALYAAMSGSGSTMLGLFGDRAAAEEAAVGFREYWTYVGGFVPAA
jgi:4-diphosphocytidyl-2-C-methyl-D-erythritol kinase